MLRRSQAHEKMPCGHERTSSNSEKLVNRGGCPLSKRYLDQKNGKLYPKEHNGPMPSLTNSDQRYIILTLVALEPNTWKILSPFPQPVQGSDLRNHLESEAHINGNDPELSPPVSIIIQVDLPKEQQGSAKSCSSSGANVLEQSHNSTKPSKSVKNSSSASLCSPNLVNNISGFECDGSDFLVSNITKVDKPVKRISRKKGKKKGKRYKKPTQKKVFPASETQSKEGNCNVSVSETHFSSDTVEFSSLRAKDITVEQDKSKVNDNGYTSSSATPLTSRSYSSEIDESEIASFSQRSAGEELSCNQLGMDEECNHLAIKYSSILSPEITRSASDENGTYALPIQNGIHYDMSSIILFDQDNPLKADTFIDNRKTDISENSSDDVETRSFIMDDGKVALDTKNCDISFCSIHDHSCDRNSEVSSNCRSTNHYWSKDIVDTDNSTERSQCSSEASSSNDFQPVIYRKKGRLAKKLSQSLNGIHRFGTTNMHDRTTKDNNHSMWQRVQKKDTKECIRESKKFNLVSRRMEISSDGSETKTRSESVVGLEQNGNVNLHAYTCSEMADQTAQMDFIKASSNKADSSELLSKAVDERDNVHDKLKRKPSSASKQGNHYVMKKSHTGKTNMDMPSKIHVQQKGLEISFQATHHQCIDVGLSPSSNDFRSVVVMPTDKVDCQSGPHHKTQINVEKDAAEENIHSMVCHSLSQDTENLASPFAMASTSLDHRHIKVQYDSDKDMPEDFCPFTDSEGSKFMKSESENSQADNSKLVSTSISVLQKWVPVGKKDSVALNTSRTSNLTVSIVNESAPDSLNSKNEEVESLGSNSPHSLQTNGVPCLSPCSEDTGCPSTEAAELTKCHPLTCGEFGGVLAVSHRCLTHKVKDQCLPGFESDLIEIVQAVGDSYKLQIASQGVQLVTGRPIAEFERFLHSASPILDQIYCTISCNTCSMDQLIGDSLCGHQIPNISLGSFWQWYEKPGSYGMEVKVEDYYDSKRSRNGQFHAYFVPYLSAVQLFGSSRNSVCANNGDPSELVMEACEVGKTSKSSFPILSLPSSVPRNEADDFLLRLSSSTKDKVCSKSVRSTQLGDEELLFEYFESDQPRQRRPLFEKIKELVRGDASSSCQIYGDPLKLECLNLHDLHPASWYSVAWYPIYRIPDGNLRAAFLTYHSLGHFVHSTCNTPGGDASIVSPVVGVQSYNAKGECWFQARGLKYKVSQTEEAPSSDHSEILKERLRTLERTASVMARASVRKENLRCVNRQPDYEFFVSRRQ